MQGLWRLCWGIHDAQWHSPEFSRGVFLSFITQGTHTFLFLSWGKSIERNTMLYRSTWRLSRRRHESCRILFKWSWTFYTRLLRYSGDLSIQDAKACVLSVQTYAAHLFVCSTTAYSWAVRFPTADGLNAWLNPVHLHVQAGCLLVP